MEVDPRDIRIAELEAENQQLREQLAKALARIEEVEKASFRQAAPFRRRDQKKVPSGEKKRPGRKAGHKGSFRQPPAVIDQEIDVPLDCCPVCGGGLCDVGVVEQIIEEIEPVRPIAVKLTTRRGYCCGCRKQVKSTHPLQTSDAGGCAKVQVGPRALALGAMLNKACGLTMRKTVLVMEQLCGLKITPGGLSQMLDRVADRLEGDYQQLIESVRKQPAVFADETSWWVGGPGYWLWTFTCPDLTIYCVKENRGSNVVIQMLGDNFGGILVSDCLSSYDSIDCRKHKCIAHHLRAIEAAQPTTGDPSAYLCDWKQLLKMTALFHKVRADLTEQQWKLARSGLEKKKDELFDQPVSLPGDMKIRNRLIKHREHLLRCLEDPRAEPTNNRAERSLRPAVIARKVSCGNKTENGRQTWEVICSIAATCKQRGQNLVQFICSKMGLAVAEG